MCERHRWDSFVLQRENCIAKTKRISFLDQLVSRYWSTYIGKKNQKHYRIREKSLGKKFNLKTPNVYTTFFKSYWSFFIRKAEE